MHRDFDRNVGERGVNNGAAAPLERQNDLRNPSERPTLGRDPALFQLRQGTYRVSAAEKATMLEIGTFRTVAIDDLSRHHYKGNAVRMHEDLRALAAQGLVQSRTIWNGSRTQSLRVVVLSKLGKEFLERFAPERSGQAIHARLVKAREARHDAAIYRMFQAERQKLQRSGARIRRVVLDYELKRMIYSPLAKAKQVSPAEYAKCQIEIAQQVGLKVVDGKIPLPDLRLEYETATGDRSHVDLELATGHYHGGAMQAKAQAGFKFYVADGSRSKLTRVLEERDLTVAILSL